ncbi:MAG TPA: hypothetical protein VKK79_21655 [Candidatus Lokiarchaeia archaeon]|nr:hypothetical protein [Candidatus Lokiarchaeia archaeon]
MADENWLRTVYEEVQQQVQQQIKLAHKKLVSPRWVRIAIYFSVIVFLSGLLIAVLVALAYGGTQFGPGTYSIATNYISDLGSPRFTPAPYILNGAEMAGAITIMPITFFLHQLIHTQISASEITDMEAKVSTRGCEAGFYMSLAGNVGMFCCGIWTIDGIFAIHFFVSTVAFVGFAGGACSYGFISLTHDSFIPKPLGVVMFVIPVTSVALYYSNFILQFAPQTTLEWFMLLAIIWWILPISAIVSRMISRGTVVSID